MDRSTILDLLDQLSDAQCRLEAIIMASNALPNSQLNVMQTLACDCSAAIELVGKALQEQMSSSKEVN